jgi:hypothetical protein
MNAPQRGFSRQIAPHPGNAPPATGPAPNLESRGNKNRVVVDNDEQSKDGDEGADGNGGRAAR